MNIFLFSMLCAKSFRIDQCMKERRGDDRPIMREMNSASCLNKLEGSLAYDFKLLKLFHKMTKYPFIIIRHLAELLWKIFHSSSSSCRAFNRGGNQIIFSRDIKRCLQQAWWSFIWWIWRLLWRPKYRDSRWRRFC